MITYYASGTGYTNIIFYIFSFTLKPLSEVLTPFAEDKTEIEELSDLYFISNVYEPYL